jgi:hypothetical protein
MSLDIEEGKMQQGTQHVHDQTETDFKSDEGLGTAIFFLQAPQVKNERMATIRAIGYRDAISRLANTHGFKWIPYSAKSHAEILTAADAGDCGDCPNSYNCPGSCYCSGGGCWNP